VPRSSINICLQGSSQPSTPFALQHLSAMLVLLEHMCPQLTLSLTPSVQEGRRKVNLVRRLLGALAARQRRAPGKGHKKHTAASTEGRRLKNPTAVRCHSVTHSLFSSQITSRQHSGTDVWTRHPVRSVQQATDDQYGKKSQYSSRCKS